MQLQCEPTEKHTIQSYAPQIKINHKVVQGPFLLDANKLIHLSNQAKASSQSILNEIQLLDALNQLGEKPQILIIASPTPRFPSELIFLNQRQIGVECMPLAAACRTFNLLLAEGRKVALFVES